MTSNSRLWSDATLDRFKRSADPLADDCIAALLASGDVEHANQVLAHLDGNGTLPADTPAALAAFLAETAQLPEGTDAVRLQRAQAFFTTYGAQFGVSLLCRSLPVLYTGRQGGAQILASTGKLTEHFERRASETLRFILDAAQPGGLAPGGAGLLTIRKVRLMHAAIRHFARMSSNWPTGRWHVQWGEPINQEELVGTMLAFSLEAMAGLRELGVPVTRQDMEDQLYLWKTIGYVLGITPAAMPRDIPEARKVWKALARRNFGASPDGILLTQAHVAFLQQNLPAPAHGLVPALMSTLLGRRNATYLGLHSGGNWEWAIALLRLLFRIKARLAGSSHTAQSFMGLYGHALMEGLQQHWAGKDPGKPFRIPQGMGGPAATPATVAVSQP
ncbi:Rubber oxygenase [Andreprevotia sp. IGB-42]|uniref:oxygenase MpaB family protein n=1 Tax=Andreprevotia sp. IGB-42 TaxID=2497473 RepID=UPI00135AC587|nr:oxygenase MpaB family protein [Andreprevotia sp. IGB-42]KAF0812979.1 Rubber oxygenase [Andreprevotia sp. IGB-42]